MKGIFYSVVTLLFLAPLILLMITYLNYAETTTSSFTTKALGDKMVSFSTSIDSDLPRASYIISKRAVDSAVVHVDTTGVPLDDAEVRLKELMTNGTLYGNLSTLDFTFNSWIIQLKQKGQSFGFNTSARLASLSIVPSDNYNLLVSVQLIVNVTDKTGTMRLDRLYGGSSVIPIGDFIDPLYTLKTNGIIKRTITIPNITVFGQQNLDYAVAKKFYMRSTSGPSFLDRLEGRLTIGPKYQGITNIGLETIVNLPELQANGLPVKQDQSAVDYLYFDTAMQSGTPVNSSYSWLRLDAEHKVKFGV
ncbi:MAG: hypothetical protein NT120_03930 [Candidatus Aenigmarchaeota archaeon]|nr:hypothetical protein [Candidatus Aenigmarchaeota archaeon]